MLKSRFLVILTSALICLWATACVNTKPYYNAKKVPTQWEKSKPSADQSKQHTLFLIGDVGAPDIEQPDPTLQLLKKQIEQTGADGSVVFLGDNIYPRGLPDSSRLPVRELAQRRLEAQLKIVENFEGSVVFIPGNHDWAKGSSEGWEQIRRQEKFVENYLQKGNTFLPSGGCPGPVELELDENLVLILIDTQWWLHQWKKPGEESECDAKGDADFIALLDDAIKRHPHQQIVVAGHHPLISNGPHGGHFPLREHIFPFARQHFMLPLPVFGSLYVAQRKWFGNIQDIPNPRYRQLRNNLFQIFAQRPDLIYTAGHEHTLQYHHRDSLHHIVSGAGCKQSYVARKSKATFAYAQQGFARLDFYENGEVWLAFWTSEGEDQAGRCVYRQKLTTHKAKAKEEAQPLTNINYADSTITRPVGKYNYEKAGKIRRFNFGDNYRKEWATPVEFPYFDIGKEKGGLEIVKRGGGQATNSLRLEAKDGRQYNLRSVDKQADKALGDEFKGTIVADIVQDQTSAAHPYGALAVPVLAEAAGLHHTNPRYVYLPKDPRLGTYQYTFGGQIYLFEERPDDDWRNSDFFGNSKDIESTAKVVEETIEDNDDLVDQLSVVKHRLFDIWIGDWDRHDDQWRWAKHENKEEDYKTYQPIPRDRDQVFFFSDGWIMDVGTHSWGLPKLQGFRHKIRDVNGLNFNGRYFDRYFMTEPSLEDWLAIADTLQQVLTDEVIDKALAQIPPEVGKMKNEEIKTKLQQRRADLSRYAREYYLFLAKKVTILGSDKHELFEVERVNDEETRVSVYKVKKNSRVKKRKIYERIFKRSETNEIRLYGLKGDDEFLITGKVNQGIKVRIIAGGGEDKITDQSQVRGWSKKTVVYDKPKGVNLQAGPETKNRISNKSSVNSYNRESFKYNYLGPTLFFGYNIDDGIFIGGGVNIITHGFRKEPYATRQVIKGNYAIASNSYNFVYQGEFKELVGPLDLVLEADIRAPNYVRNFFGLGNETNSFVDEEGINFHRVRFRQYLLRPELRKQWNGEMHSLSFGTFIQNIDVEENDGRFINNFDMNGLNPQTTFDRKTFSGLSLSYAYQQLDNELIPTRGLRFNLENRYVRGLDDDTDDNINYFQISSSLSTYISLGQNVIIAARVGGAHHYGDFEFFQANTIGGKNNLRGYRAFRFAGRSSFYQNTDLRIRLFKLRSFLSNGYFGILALNDIGRVWADGEDSSKLHHGYGGGIWFTPAQALVLNATYTASEEDNLFFLRFGFLF